VLQQAVGNHIESFNAFLEIGLDRIVQQVPPIVIEPDEGNDIDPTMRIFLRELKIDKPMYQAGADRLAARDMQSEPDIYPADCRSGHFTYGGLLKATFEQRMGDDPNTIRVDVDLGNVPIMVRTLACNLQGLGPKELVKRREDFTEYGGYFIMNGIERVIRMLIMPRANFPMALIRGSYKNRGKLYTDKATTIRCMRPDGSTLTNTLHYCRDGSCTLRFSHMREEWLIPLATVAYCLHPVNDQLLLDLLSGGSDAQNIYLRERALVMLQQQHALQPHNSQKEALRYLGSKFRVCLRDAPRKWSDDEVGADIVRRFFFVHTKDGWEKLQCLCVLFQKLMGLVREQLEPDNQDTMSSHEVLLPGQLYGMVMKESIEVAMVRARQIIVKWLRKSEGGRSKENLDSFKNSSQLLKRALLAANDVDKRMQNFMSTGNVGSRSGLDLMQKSGYTIVADKLNALRYSSHFVSIHRGQYFAEMKTTTVRKLLPETWGFLCPVHTPDGSPCGLLNHISNKCRAVWRFPEPQELDAVAELLGRLGAEIRPRKLLIDHTGTTSPGWDPPPMASQTQAWVMLDGRALGHVDFSKLEDVAKQLRAAKVDGQHGIPDTLEIVCILRDWKHLFPGLYLFLSPSRLMRPIKCLRSGKLELVGPLEQLFLNVAVLDKELAEAQTMLKNNKYIPSDGGEIPEQLPADYTHQEINPTEIFSMLANLTPFSNHNQSPRNMYQCQMLKQTMGTPYHNHVYRTDNKVYRIQTPMKPLVRTELWEEAGLDAHPPGFNAVVAVITYTGYDMEDAMIINKASYDRGFGDGSVYKVKIIDAAPDSVSPERKAACYFSNVLPWRGGVKRVVPEGPNDKATLQDDGFPAIGTLVKQGDAICCVISGEGKPVVTRHKDAEDAFVEQVSLINGFDLPSSGLKGDCSRVSIKLRMPRRPLVGDKFSSRHGQKGVMSILWPSEDMPFTESGIQPDILFNPHGFPSRMTMGMLIESFAGKGAAMEGKTVNATTFRSYSGRYCENDNEHDTFLMSDEGKKATPTPNIDGPEVAEYFGSCLAKHGFQRLGTERMYSGIHGTELETQIFMGVIYYQRLRHMVSDKAQVRARGPVDRLTAQPLKGRQRHGGIRFGEMERDSLLAHGTAFLLHDRLMRSSDHDIGYVCPKCGSILTPQSNAHIVHKALRKGRAGEPWECPPCSKEVGQSVRCIEMPLPWVFRYLTCELAAMNIRCTLKASNRARQASLSGVPSPEVFSGDGAAAVAVISGAGGAFATSGRRLSGRKRRAAEQEGEEAVGK